jgi:SAM-dependent methyltransferase
MGATDMREFWDQRARENALFFVDNRVDYARPDGERFWHEGERDLDHMLDQLAVTVRESDVVLDLGCGVGRLTRVLARRAREVWALDVSAEMLDRARRLNGGLDNVHWIRNDGRTLAPLADGSVDACVSLVVFQHIPDPAVTLGYVAEMGRVLRPGGWAVFQVSTDPRVHRRRLGPRAWWQRLLARAGRAPRGQDDPRWRGSAVSLADLRQAAAAANLMIVSEVNAGHQFCLIRAERRDADS